jgi:CDP-paratose synthetase
MKIALTGGTGFLGSHLLVDLLKYGHDVVVVKRTNSKLDRIAQQKNRIELIDIDRLDHVNLVAALKGVDAIIHTATNYGRDGESPSEVFDANTAFPLRLLDAGVASGVERFINTDTALDKYLNLYSLSKNQFLQWGTLFSRQKKLRFINLKLEHFFGAFDDKTKFTEFVFRSCRDNLPSVALTPGDQMRDFIYIEDVVSAYRCVMNAPFQDQSLFEEFEIGSGQPVSVREFVELVHAGFASSSSLDFGALAYRDGEVMYSKADTSKLNALGWRCEHSLRFGVSVVVSQYKELER